MKKVFALLLCCLCVAAVNAQTISATTYPFVNISGTSLADLSTGATQIIPADGDDPVSAVTNIGFDFWFNGIRQTQFSVNGNGLLRLGSTVITGEAVNAMTSTTNVPKIAAYWDDLRVGTDGGVYYKLTGTAPNRVLVIEWRNMCIPKPPTSSPGNATFQCWLSESSGKIDFVYGPGIVVATGYSYSIGFGTSATQFASVTSITPSCAYGTANDAQTDTIATGTQYTFTPLTPAAPTGLTFTSVGLTATTLNWTDNSTNEVGFAIYQSTDGTNYTFLTQAAANATTYAVTGLTPGALYYYKVYAVTEGGLSTPLSGSQSTTACSMSGTYVVGPTGTYTTIATAYAALQANGVSGPVALELQTTYAGEAFPISLGVVPCASATNNIIIRPQGTMTVTGTGGPTFGFDGAQYVTIDGRVGSTGTTKALTISNTTTNAADIRFSLGANYDTLRYCRLLNVNTSTNTGAIFFNASTAATGNSNNVVDNCDFDAGATPYVCGIYSSGTAGKENNNNIITNCNFANFFSATVATCGINITASSSGWTINNNRFYQTAARTYTTANTHRAILISTGNGYTVTNNTIGYSSATATGTYAMAGTVTSTFRGIELAVGTTTPSSVQGNTITNMSFTGGVASMIAGIYITSGSVNVGTTSANTIGGTTGTGLITVTNTGTANPAILGIYTTAASPAVVNIQNNNVGGLTATGAASAGEGIWGIQALSTATLTISGNTIGSTSTANSINSNFNATSPAYQVYGINTSNTSAAPVISNNTIANLNNAGTSTLALIAGIIQSNSGATTISGNTVRNISGASGNVSILGQTGVAGIAYTGTGTATIIQNTVNAIMYTNAASVQSNVSGICYASSVNGSILRNRIYDLRNASTMAVSTTPPTATGILIGSGGGAAITIANNMISLGNGQTTNTEFMGISNSGTVTPILKVYYNSINIEGTATSGALPTIGFHRGNNSTTAITTTVDLRNNIITNGRSGGTGKHYAIANGVLVTTGSATGWGTNASNYNILNATSTTVGFWSTDQTLATWRTASAGDGNSYSGVTTTFVNTATGDLHLSMGTTPNYIESHGTTIAAVTNDYDNDSRPGPAGSVNGGGILPDLGADEFDGVSIDDVAPVITYTVLPATCATTDRTLSATIVDQSGVPAAGSGTEPRVYYKKGLSGTWYSRPGTLSSGTVTNGTWSFPIVSADMSGISGADKVYYYVVAQDVMSTPNIGASPGTGFAATSVTSITTPPATPNNYFVNYTSGTFNVGAGQTFTTITEAVNTYNANSCLTGPVTFVLTDAAYSASETFPITISNNPLASAAITITIRPASGVAAVVTGLTSSASVFKLLNAQYVTIDGVNTGGSSLTLTNMNTGTSAVVWLASTVTTGPGNKNVSLLNMNMNGGLATSSTNWGIIAGVDGSFPAGTNGMDNDSITIQGNYIKKCGYSMWLGGAAVTAAGGDNGWVIRNNILGPSAYSATDNLGVNGMFMRNMQNLIFSGNTMQNVGFTSGTGGTVGMYVESGIDGIVIDSNIVDTVVANTTSGFQVCAFYFNTGNKNVTISRNRITAMYNLNTGGYGARGIVVTNGTAASNFNIVNNFISDVYNYSSTTLANWAAGISVDGTSGGVNIYNNSINLYGSHVGLTTATGSAAILITSTGTGFDVRNNLLVNTYENTSSSTDKTYAIYSSAANSTYSNIDYNNYYTSGGTPMLGYIGGADRPTLTDMIAGFGGNSHSINETAPFTSSTDLHIPAGTVTPLESAGTSAVGITTDIDGQVRPGPAGSTYGGGTAPDIGADEFDGSSIDGTAPLVTYTALSTTTCSTGDRTLSGVTISDMSGVPTTGSLMPRIYFKKNAGSWYSAAGTLTSGTATNGTWSFPISATTVGGLATTDAVTYYVVAQDVAAIPNLGGYPSVGLAGTDVNTISTPPATPYTYTVTATLGGTYTVGATGTFTTITTAINTYNTACLTGPVTFVLTDATYPSETYPMTIRANSDASATNMLTIKPDAGVAVNISGTTTAVAIFKMLNAKYITIDGLNTGGSSLTLNSSNTASANADVWLASTATTGPGNKNISLLNMNINGGLNTSATNYGIIACVDGASPAPTNGMDNDSVIIQGNYIKKCGYSIFAAGTAVTAAGGLNGWVIKNNILGPMAYSATDNLGVNGMFLRNMTNVIYTGNTMQNVATLVGMYIEAGVDGIVIDSNIVDSVFTTTAPSIAVCAFYLGSGVKNATISRNKISSIYALNATGYGARGITVTNATAASNVTIVNNFISDIVSYSSTTVANWVAGIGVDGTSGGINIYNNSINLYGSHPGLTTATGSADITITSTGGGIDVRNNILNNSYENTSSTTDKTYAIYSNVTSTNFSNIDYNDYYTSGGTPVLGNIGGIDRLTLADVITGFGGNANSVNAQPAFISNTDLHLQIVNDNASLVPCAVLSGITTDIDNTVRSTSIPVMGAQEANLASLAPAILYAPLANTCTLANRTISATIRDVFTGVPTSGTQVPRIYYRKNAGTWFSYPGTLSSGTGTSGVWNFTILATDLGTVVTTDSIFYYVIAQDNSGNVGSVPSTGLVATDVNSVTSAPTNPNSYSVLNLSGTYAVGSGGVYPTITSAVNAYNNGCPSGPVTFLLTDATYPSETYPITILANASASATNTLTIKPATGIATSITGSTSAVAVFKFLNAKYVTLDGVNTGGSSLTVTNSNPSTSSNTCDIWLAAGSAAGSGNNNITLKNMAIIGGAGNTTTNQGIVAGIDGASPANTAGMDNDNITITGNSFIRMGYTIRALGTAATSAGGLDNWTISNNIMGPLAYSATDNLGYNGLLLNNMLNVVLSGNTMQNVGYTNASYTIAGFYLQANVNGIVISGNTLTNMTSIGTGTGAGANMAIYLGPGVTNATVTGNNIHTISNNNTAGYGARAIIANTGNTTSNIVIANNLISDIYGYSNTAVANWPAGVGLEGTTGGVNMYYNTISMNSDHVGLNNASGSACLIVNSTGGTFDVRNNIFSNTYDNTSSATDKGYAIYSAVASSVFSNIDYNDYYAATPNVLGYISGDRAALSDIVTGFGGNANSINTQPIYVSATDPHLQLHAGNVPLKAGSVVGGISTDVDGATRGTPPVIGADEVVIPDCSGTPAAGTVIASPSAGCGTFTSSVNLGGSTFLPGITYQWESSSDDVTYTAVSGATNQAYTASVTSTIYYRATLTCTVSGMSATTAGLQLTVNPVPSITGAATVCNGATATLGATVSGGTWVSSAATVAAIGSTTGFVTGVAVGTSNITYTVTSTGCNASTTITVNPNPLPLSIAPASLAICASGPSQLLTSLSDSVLLPAYFGTQQNVNTTSTYPAPFSIYYGGQRVQMLVLASELTARGYTAGTDLTSMEMPVVSVGTSYTGNPSFQVRIAPSSLTSLTAFVTTGLVTVRDPATYVAAAGNNVIPFNTPYTWDGTSNLIVDMTFSIGAVGSSLKGVVQYNTNTSFPSMVVYRADNQTPAAAAAATSVTYSYSARTDFRLIGRQEIPVTWTPSAGLYTDGAATTAYAGTSTDSIYTLPTAAATYVATSNYNGCTSTATTTVTVKPLPADIAGADTVCVGSTTTLTNDTTDGTWSSNVPAIASVGSATGIVTGVAAGVATMTYTKSATGCFKVMQMTVNPLPAATTGTTAVCEAATTTLADVDGGGVWGSDAASVATVGSATGVVTGVSAGFAQITYTLPTSCSVTQQVTVNPVPAISVTPTPVPAICFGGSATLTASTTMNTFALMSQDFNGGLGAWTISNTSGSTASYWQLTASPGYSGTTGDGSQMIQAAPDAYMGITSTRFTSPSFSTVGYGAVTLSFNEYLLSLSSSDDSVAVEYSTDGGTLWNPVLDQIDDLVGSGSWTGSSPEVSVALPAGALGQSNVKLRWNYYSNQGLWWAIDNIRVTAAHPAPSYTWSGVSGATGLSCTACASVDVTPASSGANVYSVVAATTAGCTYSTSATITVNPLPSTIGGMLVVCRGATTTAADVDASGTWSTSGTAIVTIDAATGEITGVANGTAEITYTLPTGCTTTAVVTVNATPAAIDGIPQVCQGLTTTLNNTDPGGTWGSSASGIADIDASGMVSGVSAGTATISYSFATGCKSTLEVTVNPLPATIGGALAVCEGLTTTLTDATADGTWSSSTPAIADIGSASGVVAGNLVGTTDVTYTLPTGCITTTTVTVNHTPVAIGGILQVCQGLTTTLGNTDLGGTWSSSAISIADIDASGVVSGVSAGTATITYALATGCMSTVEVTVNPLPAAIGGTLAVCEGLTTTLTDATADGTWSSSSSAMAGIGSVSGVVTGNLAGATDITYTLPTGCITTATVTVNHTPASIGGILQVCQGLSTTFSNTDLGGTWSSSAISIADIDASGVVSGVSAGTATISYAFATGCMSTVEVTVNPLPATIGGTLAVCEGLTTTLADATADGTWSSSSPAIAGIGSANGVVIGNSVGTTDVTYTLPTGCIATAAVTVNHLPASIGGVLQVCEGSTTTLSNTDLGGSWVSNTPGIATIDAGGVVSGLVAGNTTITYTLPTGCITTAVVTVNPMPAAIGGTMAICPGATSTLTDGVGGGTWIIGATGIATIGASTGIVSSISAGLAPITYTLPAGCYVVDELTVNPNPAAIGGVLQVCEGSTTTLSNTDLGGTWASSAPGIATIDVGGVVSGQLAGNTTITYTLPTGCTTTSVVTINPMPAAIGGTMALCPGATSTLTDGVGGGTWSSSAIGIAAIGSSTGIVSSVSAGLAPITYTLPAGCYVVGELTVNPNPAAIGGVLQVCEGSTTTLSNTALGGTWVSSTPGIATIDVGGVVSGLLAGNTAITYTLPTGCITTSVVTVNPMPAAIGGTIMLCQGVTVTLTDGISGGTWSSGATTVAIVGSASGAVTGVSAGFAMITYTLPGGCNVTANVTVNASPATIAGTPEMCVGSATSLTDPDPGGSWTSSAPGIATISGTGIVSGLGNGTATITYALSPTCIATTMVTVDPLPAPIVGPSQLCMGATGTFTNGMPGGTWTSNTPLVATIDITTGATIAMGSGTSLITYTSTAGCVRTRTLTVNALPAAITGTSELCRTSTITLADATIGGSWSSGAGAIATIGSAGIVSGVSDGIAPMTYTLPTGCIAVTSVTVNPMPSAIGGTTSVCLGQTTTLSNTLGGGTWNSGMPGNALIDATTGVVTGVGVGTSFITYTSAAGCSQSIAVTVNAMPAAITGATNVCQGATMAMTTTSTGGVWTSSVTSVASINLATGVVTGLAAGTTFISYTIPAGGCFVTRAITVDAMPAAFTGSLSVCRGQTTALATTPTGGTWSSSNLAVATVDVSGVVSGITAGTSAITYTLASGCVRSTIVSVNALPSAYNVTGGGNYCSGTSGVHIGLDNSNGGVSYQLYLGVTAIGTPVTGVTGMPLDFGTMTAAGTYSVFATSTTTGCGSNMTGMAAVSLTASVPALVSFSSGTGSDTVCSGLPVTFTATATNGGTAPVYQWKVNGIVVMGATTNIYTHVPSIGDVVVVNMGSSIACAIPAIATASRTLVVNSSVMPVAAIMVTPGASICAGSSATFSASALYGGSAPSYTWLKNGSFAAAGPSYSYVPANGDNIVVKLASNHACALADTVLSSVVTMTVSPAYLPSVTIGVAPGTMVQTGTTVTITTTETGGGPSPEYQWYVGSWAIAGATSATFVSSTFADGDSVSCAVRGSGTCGLIGTSSVIMHVGAAGIGATPGMANLRLMPNPNKGEFAVKGTLPVIADQEMDIEVTNMLGQVVYRTIATARNGVVDAQLKLDNTLANGMYMLNLHSLNENRVFHFVLEQ